MVCQEAAAVLLGEKAVEAPVHLFLGADIEDVNLEQIARFGPFHTDRAGKVMYLFEFDVAHVGGIVVILDLAAGPVIGFDLEIVPRLDPDGDGNVGMPAIVYRLIGVRAFGKIDRDKRICHVVLSLLWSNG
jgi:hypothetical protein